jgi:cytochrome c oxidase cbb3-type subunit 3
MRTTAMLVLIVLAGSLDLAGQDRTRESPTPQDSITRRGKRIFEGAAGCHGCHGEDGRGTTAGPDLTDRDWLHGSGTFPEVCDRIEHGISRRESKSGRPMPIGGWEPLSPDDVAAVAAYVRWLATTARHPQSDTGQRPF